MADSKITALTAISTVDPAADPLVIVDVSDTSMAASGTTKKATINQLLGASGTATLASATISGDLTVDTNTLKVDSANNWVGVGTATPAVRLHSNVADAAEAARFSSTSALLRFHPYVDATDKTRIQATNGTNTGLSDLTLEGLNLRFNTNGGLAYAISNVGVATWSNVGGVAGTAMTLNATGLGVGVSPDFKFAVNGTQAVPDTTGSSTTNGSLRIGAPGTGLVIDTGVTAAGAVYGWIQARARTDYSSNFNLVLQPNGGNVGIGVTPSAWNASFRGIDISTGGAIAGSSDSVRLFSNSAFNTAGNNVYKSTAAAGRYDLQGNVHTWNIAPSGTAGTTITFTPAMTLDGNGNLILQSSATPATLTTNGQLTVNATSNTNLRFSYRGSDGVTRVANITLA